MQLKGVRLHHGLREQEDPGSVGDLVQALNKPEGKLGKLHHGAGHVAQHHQVLPPGTLLPIAQTVKTASGFQAFSDGFPEVQHVGAAGGLTLSGELPVNLSSNGLDDGNGLGNFRVPKFGDVPVENANFRVHLFPAQTGVFHEHLLLHQGFGKDGVDEVPVKLGVALGGAPVFFHEILQLLAGLLGHGGVDFPLLLR